MHAEAVAIDIVVPVYNAAADLARCVESVLAHTARRHRLVLIDDASPDPAIGAFFAELERRGLPHVVLLANERNLGFTGTANRGMALSDADVVLLNSDTVVTAGWLDALARCAASDPAIGTVTPFSNNAEICSFPRFCEDNPWPEGADPEPVRAALAQAAVPSYPELPTGVGFCFYVRRALIAAIGTFDPAFGLGYGEENDLCLRAAGAGFRNVLCDDAFVLHLGGRSFEGQKATLGARNLELLAARHPTYHDLVRTYIAADPLRPIRNAALARHRVLTGPARGVLHVIDGREGGTETLPGALIDASRHPFRHYVARAAGDTWQLDEHPDDDSTRTFAFRRLAGESWMDFVGGLCVTFGIVDVHLHDISGCRDGVVQALAGLGASDVRAAQESGYVCPTLVCGRAGAHDGAAADAPGCEGCVALASDGVAPFAPVRVRDAAGYRPWTPAAFHVDEAPTEPVSAIGESRAATTPAIDDAAAAAIEMAPDRGGKIARVVLQLRQTLPGRVLYRLTPARVRKALKSRLR